MGYGIPQTPQPPSDAYYAVATHLHDSYFLTKPPTEGAVVIVECADGSASQWAFSAEMAARVIAEIGADPMVCSIGTALYHSATPAK